MVYVKQLKRLYQVEGRRLFPLFGIAAICILLLQTLTLPHRFGLNCLFPNSKLVVRNGSDIQIAYSLSNSHVIRNSSIVFEVVGIGEVSSAREESGHDSVTRENGVSLENKLGIRNNLSQLVEDDKDEDELLIEEVSALDQNFEEVLTISKNDTVVQKGDKESDGGSSTTHGETTHISEEGKSFPTRDGSAISNDSVISGNTTAKKLRCDMPPKTVMTISEMNSLLLRRRASRGLLKPQWLSLQDKELLSARSQIENAPIIRGNPELYAPLFRNVSMFKRSYELMDSTLKVYVYKEGEKPIFHQPIMKGLYASEGWFMKLMEGNKKFTVKDPKRAHLLYMPFSTRMLEYSLYVRNSHNRTNLAAYLRNYTHVIAAKYSSWNRTDGADHFFVACHDWAPYETRHHMERCIKSMCNADVTQGFKIGKDVSLPETYVRSQRNPVRDIGGEPPSNRSILAFFAGSMHGYLRPILLSHWKNKDPDMKIFGRMPFGVASKMNYIRHMKTSKYCICAKGYEVNSPRVVEAIFYECVPVIISDNFVPPFFDVLNWDAFSVFVPEKDIPNLKKILLDITYEKYLEMQMAVRKVQRHFVWHNKAVKYDLFHMTLHSIWYNRVFTIKADKLVTKKSIKAVKSL
ncbi:hypothetical protein ACHQM5_028749 [Ranunculus cassubicifolius]